MIGGPRTPRSCLASLQPVQRDAEEEKRKGWHDHRILVVAENDSRLSWAEREMIKHLAKKLFGKHGGKEVCHGR